MIVNQVPDKPGKWWHGQTIREVYYSSVRECLGYDLRMNDFCIIFDDGTWRGPVASVEEVEALRADLAEVKRERDWNNIALSENQKLRDLLDKKLAECRTRLEAWQSSFGTSQLSHAAARLEAAEGAKTRLEADRDRLAKWIVSHPTEQGGDHACRDCYPHSDMLQDGFVCAYHEAVKIVEHSDPATEPTYHGHQTHAAIRERTEQEQDMRGDGKKEESK